MPLQATSGAASYDAFGGGVPVVPEYIEEVFSTYLYTGNGTDRTITNGIDLSTKSGLVWIKARSAFRNHVLADNVSNQTTLATNLTEAPSYGGTGTVTGYNTTGFNLGTTDASNSASAFTYVSWTFRKQPKFFDIVTYTGTGSVRTVAHNLGSTPGCIIVKKISAGEATDWGVYHRSLGATYKLNINTDAIAALSTGYWNNTEPTSSVFTVATSGITNESGATYVAYIFAHNAGGFGLTGTDNVISCGSFTTPASGDATITLGYEPQWLMVKSSSNTSDWYMVDNMRGLSQTAQSRLDANLLAAEESNSPPWFIPTATGFTAASGSIGGSRTFIYIAIRRGPMKVPTSGTSVFKPNATSAAAGTVVTTNFPVDLEIGNFLDNYDNKPFTDRLRGYATSTSSRTGAPFINSVNTQPELTTGAPFSYNWWNKSVIIGNYISEYRQVSYYFGRAPNFFDIVCYTGTGAAGLTVTHNLTVPPELIIVKSRSLTGEQWPVYASPITVLKVLQLNTTIAATTYSDYWNNTAPTSSVFSVGSTSTVNQSAATYVAYLFATCAGVSKVGSYTGNGSTQTINCGFGAGGARFVLIKRTDSTGDWYVYDSSRGMTVVTDPYLRLNTNEPEVATLGSVTTVSTGFALNAAILAAINTNAASYIFLAIA